MSGHKGFSTLNYNRFECNGCNEITVIEPGQIFTGEMNCKCKVKEALDNTEVSTPVLDEVDYQSTTVVTVIGVFKDGDYEVSMAKDLEKTYRVPKATFEADYELIETPAADVPDPVESVTLSLDMLEGKTLEQIKEEFNMDELRVLAKACKIRGAANTGEDKLIKKLLEKLPKAE